MRYIHEFGYDIYRIREAKAESEYILYNRERKTYCQINERKVLSLLLMELRDKSVNIIDFAIKHLGYYEKVKPENILKTWIEDETILVDNIAFCPIPDIIFNHKNKTYFNTFNFIETLNREKYKLPEPMSYDEFKKKAPYHHKLFYNLHNKDENAIKDTLLKIADKLRFPQEKPQDCIIFYPGEGAGKGILYKYVLEPIFGEYTKKVLMRKLKNEFNGFLQHCLCLVIEEGKRDIELIEILKEATTEHTMLINDKGKSQTEERIYFLTFVFSNHMNPLDLGKRRGSYHLTHSLGKTVEDSQIKGRELCENLPNETETLLQYLHSLEFEHQEALMPFNTKAKTQVTDLNKTPIELFYDHLITYDSLDKALIDLHYLRYNNIFEFNVERYKPHQDIEEEYISKDLIREAYNNFCFMEGLKSNIIRHNKDIVQLWALMKIPENAHQRIIVKTGKNQGRRIDHIKLRVIQEHIKEANKENDKE